MSQSLTKVKATPRRIKAAKEQGITASAFQKDARTGALYAEKFGGLLFVCDENTIGQPREVVQGGGGALGYSAAA